MIIEIMSIFPTVKYIKRNLAMTGYSMGVLKSMFFCTRDFIVARKEKIRAGPDISRGRSLFPYPTLKNQSGVW